MSPVLVLIDTGATNAAFRRGSGAFCLRGTRVRQFVSGVFAEESAETYFSQYLLNLVDTRGNSFTVSGSAFELILYIQLDGIHR